MTTIDTDGCTAPLPAPAQPRTAAATAQLVQLENVSARRGGRAILDGLSLALIIVVVALAGCINLIGARVRAHLLALDMRSQPRNTGTATP